MFRPDTFAWPVAPVPQERYWTGDSGDVVDSLADKAYCWTVAFAMNWVLAVVAVVAAGSRD